MDINKLEKYFINQKFKVVSEDVTFFFQNYKPLTPTQDAKINEQTGQMLKLSIAGTCLGMALSLSLRRYMPNTFGEISIKRMILDTTLILGGYVYFSKMATYSIYQNLQPLRKELVDECNQDYLKHLLRVKQAYPQIYIKNADVFKDIYNEQELKEWVEKNSSVAVIFGLQAHQFEHIIQKDVVSEYLTPSQETLQNISSQDLKMQANNNNQEKVYSFDFSQTQKNNNKQ